MRITCDKSNPLLAGLIALEEAKLAGVTVQWGNENAWLDDSNKKIAIESDNDFLRLVGTRADLYCCETPELHTQVNHWLTFTIGPLVDDLGRSLKDLDKYLAPRTYLVSNKLTIADIAVFCYLNGLKKWSKFVADRLAPSNILRWFKFIQARPSIQNVWNSLPDDAKVALVARSQNESVAGKVSSKEKSGNGKERRKEAPRPKTEGGRAQEGKFVDLPGAEMGKVVVRFPPEASGYLHIGHAKAALLNQYYQQTFDGQLIMRFDDTNPAKENVEFEKVILEDVELLQIKYDRFTYTSDYFELFLELCVKMLKDGKAYVDDTDPETMKTEREQRIESANRSNAVEQNLKLWEEMKKGTDKGQKCCVRAKIDMKSPNGCLRDPTIYRCKNEPHPRTGDKYKVYPTYDFACPIVDSIEGVTHTLRTMEYHDRDPQFYWFIEALGLRKPHIWEYSRLAMTNTVLSKRKLTWFVENGYVEGWDDPRMPTVRGILRRGMTVQGLKEFIIAQGSSRSVVVMEWDKIWAFNKKVIDPIAPRFTAVSHDDTVTVEIRGVKEQSLTVPLHPKNSDIGTKDVWISDKVLIDRKDAEMLKDGQNATFINWGNIRIKKIHKMKKDITKIEAETNLDDKDYKNTPKVTWLAVLEQNREVRHTPVWCVYYDNLIRKPVLAKDDDFKNYVGHRTEMWVKYWGDPALKTLKKNDIIQLQRIGFFRVDHPWEPRNLATGKEQEIVLFYIPDGHTKETPLTLENKEKYGAGPNSGDVQSGVQANQQGDDTSRAAELSDQIVKHTEAIAKLRAEKAAESVVQVPTNILKLLKEEFKKETNTEWTPECAAKYQIRSEVQVAPQQKPAAATTKPGAKSASLINDEIAKQGELVRKLKGDKAPKPDVEAAVKVLLALKVEYKAATGVEWKPGCVPPTPAVEAKPPAASSTKSATSINDEIVKQGELVRKLKGDKAPKPDVEAAVKVLLALKAEYKAATGVEWKPGCVPPPPAEVDAKPPAAPPSSKSATSVNDEIVKQGESVRKLKADKAPKPDVEAAVKILLALKQEYKALTNQEWKPGCCVPPAMEGSQTCAKPRSAAAINDEIVKQGDSVRKLKGGKAPKPDVEAAVKILLSLKEEYKKTTNQEWKPGCVPTEQAPAEAQQPSDSVAALNEEIAKQGDKVRALKGAKAAKADVDAAVKVLLDLKGEYKKLSGSEWKPPAGGATAPVRSSGAAKASSPAPAAKAAKPAKAKPEPRKAADEGSAVKKQTRLGLEATKEDNLPDWYSQVITKGELIEYYDVSGCYILRPWAFAIWEAIKDWFDAEIKKLGVENCYFPIFVSKAVLEKEKSHIADFSPEVAWVTKSGDSDMAEPIAVRPTSETVMYPAYAKWIQSYRDLPIKLNQWNNVVRWEFKHPQPFLRTREFLWQEGHTAYANAQEACAEVAQILELYAQIYTDLLAIPVVRGRKTEKEKFAGGDYTYTVEAFISASGRAIQGATSHHLGQNFSKIFEIVYEDPETQEKKYVYQNSWGLTTRTIGVMIMVHADNQGLVLPPRVARYQAVIVPCGITVNLDDRARSRLQGACDELEKELCAAGIRVKGDYRQNYSPGWKFNHWELKGVPIRVELGPKDLEKGTLVAVSRDDGSKASIPRSGAATKLQEMLEAIQARLLQKATDELTSHMVTTKKWSEFLPNLDKKNIIMAPFCGDMDCEGNIKNDSTREEAEPGEPAMGAKSLCIPTDQPAPIAATDKCIHPACQKKPQFYTLFGRSY